MLRSCLTLCTAATLLCGCADPDASANHEARLKFASALEKVEQANRGYTDGSSGQAADLAAFRAGGLAKAAQELSQLLNQGTPGQQSAAARVLGQTYITLSRYQVSTAQQHWEELWYPTTELLAQVNQVTLSQVRAQALENDQTPGLDQLSQYQSRFVKQDEEARRKVEELSKSITQLQASHKDLITRRDALLTKAQSHKDQAFTLSGQAQFETYQSALQTEREAQVLDAQAEKINAELDVQQANLAITQNTGKLAAANVLTIQKQAQALEQRQSEAVAQKQALISDPQNLSSVKAREATLIETITRVTQTFSQKVQPAYDEADKTAAQAVTMLEKALSQTRGDAFVSAASKLICCPPMPIVWKCRDAGSLLKVTWRGCWRWRILASRKA
ncbi:MAG: hypothetical protein HC898_11595 [Phycisphaerales bacterium]|nr:hypothetical protein [Phycisphaerales bacterium]